MVEPTILYNLYLFDMKDGNIYYEIPLVTDEESDEYIRYWMEMSNKHDYILTTCDSNLFKGSIINKDVKKNSQWITDEYNKFKRGE